MRYLKGYKVCYLTKKNIEDKDIFINFIEIDPNIKDEALETLNNNGYIIGMKSKKDLKFLCMFNYKKDNNYLKFSNLIQAKDIEKESIEEFEKAIVEMLNKKVSKKEIKGVEWEDLFSAFEWLKKRFE